MQTQPFIVVNWNYPTESGTPFQVVRIEFSGGSILCTSCAPNCNWCLHIEEFIRSSEDSKIFIWTPAGWPDGAILNVPVFPTHNIFQKVVISKHPKFDHLLEVFFKDRKLCSISQGEGCYTIRLMLIEKMLADKDRKRECNSSIHNPRSDLSFNANNRIAEEWSLWTTGNCISCEQALDFSDLVPNNDKRFPNNV